MAKTAVKSTHRTDKAEKESLLAKKRRELVEVQIHFDEALQEVAIELAEYRATEAALLEEIRQLSASQNEALAAFGLDVGRSGTMHEMASVAAENDVQPVQPEARRRPVVRMADAQEKMTASRAALATKKPREGRPDTTGHALPAAVGNVSRWAAAQKPKLSEWRVRSWYATGNAARQIPEKYADMFERGIVGQDGKIHKIPRSAWTKGVRPDTDED